jgi:5S rRNA maturation endonuclease (ribonuclease M5)
VQSWQRHWATPLAERRVVIIMDADAPGREVAGRIARDLDGHAEAILDLTPERSEGYDLTDWLRTHGPMADESP